MRVLVLGAGVNGLTAGVLLAEAGFQVDLLARELPLETTSCVAAAMWYPYLAEPRERVFAWAQRSYDAFVELAARSESGVLMRRGSELMQERLDEPWWAGAVPDVTRLEHVPAPYRDGWSFTTPVIEMPVYLRWLQRRLVEAGGTLTRMALSALPDRADLVVNCGGLGARLLADDATLRPVRGQVVGVGQVGVDHWLLDGSGPTYVVPRSNDIIVGGTDAEGQWDRRPDAQVARDILARATVLMPELAEARVLGHRVGLRPARPTVRLELEDRAGHPVIHCYGHGGAGVTTSWGCADEVLALAKQVG